MTAGFSVCSSRFSIRVAALSRFNITLRVCKKVQLLEKSHIFLADAMK
jgi:hypothetical protein